MSPSSAGKTSTHNSSKKYWFIEHQVSKMDTLAGVAIKYGVEVSDIKRLNGLATDLQMFALKTLLIPFPATHPPPPPFSSPPPGGNGIDRAPPHPCHLDVFESMESLRLKSPHRNISPAMSTLQKYYGLKSSNSKDAGEGTEMAVFRTGSSDDLQEGLLPKASPASGPPYQNCNSRNLTDSFLSESGTLTADMPLAGAGDGDCEKSNEKPVRRRQKADAVLGAGTPERLLKEENSGGSSDFSPVTGKNLAMRPKSASRAPLAAGSETGWLTSNLVALGDSIIADGLPGVRKSTSTPSLQDQDSNSSYVWPTSKWNLKQDLQAFSTAAINIPIFDGLPKPTSGRRSKAALD